MGCCRGFLAFLLVLALMLGAGRPVPSAAEIHGGATVTPMLMSAMALDLSMSGMCDKCPKKDSAMRGCAGVCVGVQAVLPVPNIQLISARALLTPFAERRCDGSAAPPDPPPPKLIFLA